MGITDWKTTRTTAKKIEPLVRAFLNEFLFKSEQKPKRRVTDKWALDDKKKRPSQPPLNCLARAYSSFVGK